jgi:hypothetical protein
MIYGIKLNNKIKVFTTQNKKTQEYIIKQHELIYKKGFKIDNVYQFKYIPSELISGNYLIFNLDSNIDEKINKISIIGSIYEDFGLIKNQLNLTEEPNNLKPYDTVHLNCKIKDSTKLILDNNIVKIKIYYSKETMKIYYNNIDHININQIDIELFPELVNVGTYEFKLSLESLIEKFLEKFYYSIDQVKLAIKGLTLNDSNILTNENLVSLFHQYFNFNSKSVRTVNIYTIEEILSTLSLTYSEEDVKEFYKLSLEYYLSKNNIISVNGKYKLDIKDPFINIPKETPINEIEFTNMINKKLKERSVNLTI